MDLRLLFVLLPIATVECADFSVAAFSLTLLALNVEAHAFFGLFGGRSSDTEVVEETAPENPFASKFPQANFFNSLGGTGNRFHPAFGNFFPQHAFQRFQQPQRNFWTPQYFGQFKNPNPGTMGQFMQMNSMASMKQFNPNFQTTSEPHQPLTNPSSVVKSQPSFIPPTGEQFQSSVNEQKALNEQPPPPTDTGADEFPAETNQPPFDQALKNMEPLSETPESEQEELPESFNFQSENLEPIHNEIQGENESEFQYQNENSEQYHNEIQEGENESEFQYQNENSEQYHNEIQEGENESEFQYENENSEQYHNEMHGGEHGSDFDEHGISTEEAESFFTLLSESDENKCISRLVCEMGADPTTAGDLGNTIVAIIGSLNDFPEGSKVSEYNHILLNGRSQGMSLCASEYAVCDDQSYALMKSSQDQENE